MMRAVTERPEIAHELIAHDHAWMVSQFMHGEQGALLATAKICAGAESIDDKYYAAAQVADEARHVEAYQRYLDKIGIEYPVSPSLHDLLADIMRHRHVDMTFLGMQILVEGVALAAFSMGAALLANPLIAQITELVRRDEARHVAFGVLSLQGFYDDMDPVDLAEREEFVLEACALMRDRFLPVQVWEHFDIDVAEATEYFAHSIDMMAFRSLMFSKVVPNLRKLGLLTPRVREGFEQMGILRYERYVDSATEAGELDPSDGAGDEPTRPDQRAAGVARRRGDDRTRAGAHGAGRHGRAARPRRGQGRRQHPPRRHRHRRRRLGADHPRRCVLLRGRRARRRGRRDRAHGRRHVDRHRRRPGDAAGRRHRRAHHHRRRHLEDHGARRPALKTRPLVIEPVTLPVPAPGDVRRRLGVGMRAAARVAPAVIRGRTAC